MKSKLIAILTAGMMLASAASVPPVLAAEQTTPAAAVASLPEWIPNDLKSAVEFRNTYGATHIDNGLICVVFKLKQDKVPDGEPQGMLRYEILTTDRSVKMLRHTYFGSEDSEYYYEAAVFDPQQAGDFDIAVIDTWAKEIDPDLQYGHAIARYSFSAEDDMNITETDIYSWLPDCEEEYWDYAEKNEHLSVKDNYVVFCLSHNAGTAYDWTRKDEGKECFELDTVSDCSPVSAVDLDGGQINTIYVYKAVKDGYDKISYYFGEVYSDDYEGQKPLVADCAVINDAQNILLSGDMRVTLVDYDTNEPLTLPDGAMPRIWTDIRQSTPDGEIFLNMQPSGFRQNPAIVRLGDFFDGYNFSFGLVGDGLPAAYSLPETEDKSAGYHNGTIVPEDHVTVNKYDNNTADVVFRLKKTAKRVLPEEKSADLTDLKKGETRITFYDKDTGELIPGELMKNHDLGFGTDIRFRSNMSPNGWIYTGPIYDVESNPQVYQTDLANLYRSADYFEFLCDDQPEVTLYDNGSMDLVIRTKIKISGNINGDNKFNIADIVTLQTWLLNSYDKELYSWAEADFDLDNRLTVFDLCLMKKELIKKSPAAYVEPDYRRDYGPWFSVVNNLKLYLGPDESYPSVATVYSGDTLEELGHNENNDTWLFTEYCGNYGWLRTVREDNVTPTIIFDMLADKPVIYLYPEQETDVRVELELTKAQLSTTYPRYNNGWDVTAYPDGTLLNKADGTHHKYLFWDAVNCRMRYDFSKGFCVAGSDTESFLKEKLTYMGLTEEEMNEFIVYWLPRMEHNAYNLISFQGDAYTDSAKLDITPAPDSMLRIFMTYVPLEKAVDIEPQQLETFERKGFTVVEWGGSEVRS